MRELSCFYNETAKSESVLNYKKKFKCNLNKCSLIQ